MAGPYHGKGGSISADNGSTVFAEVQSWDITTTADTADTTAMQASNSWMTQRIGLTDFTANTEILTTSGLDVVALINDADTLILIADSGGDAVSITGTAIPTALTETVSIDDVSRATVAWEGNDNTGLAIG